MVSRRRRRRLALQLRRADARRRPRPVPPGGRGLRGAIRRRRHWFPAPKRIPRGAPRPQSGAR
ncbi:MAG TPA: hypothetical protein VE991_06760, partial [Acidimicrobiales bacterium]|nr:hypothetical protein [Acidimicrobiales bacterium]